MAASIRDCACCGKAFESTGHGRKYCDKCRTMSQSARERLVYRRQLAEVAGSGKTGKKKRVMPVRPFVCTICGKEGMGKGNKYCPDCAGTAKQENMRTKYEKRRANEKAAEREERKRLREPSAEQLLDWHDLSGKSLARVDAEAKAFGLSYGQYTSAVRCGSIDQLLRSRGIADPAAVLREIKVK
ncbi:MAG: hypothetical protein IJY96_05145 [Oscillospiraceae bacterium]|nr:hypothetical protein [Oscillospiraceae bacterium]